MRERSEDDAYTRLKRVIVRARRTGDLDAEAEARKIAGGRAFARSEFRSARDHYRVCAERYEEIGDFANAAEALVSQAKALRAIGDYDRALGSLVHAVTCFQKAGDVVGEAQSLVEGEVIRRMQSGKALSTAELGELTLGRARQSRNRRAETRALLSLATSARGAGRAADARRHANLALELSVRFQHVRTLSAVARLLAEMDIDESDLDAAEVHAAQAVAAGRTGRRKSPLVFALYVQGLVAEKRGQLGRGRRLYAEAQKHAATGEALIAARCHLALGRIAVRLRDPATASIHFNSAMEVFQRMRDERGQIGVILGLAGLDADRGDPASAVRRSEDALEIAARLGDRLAEAAAYQYLGWLAHCRGDRHECDRFHRLSLDRCQALGHYAGVSRCLTYIADNAFLAGKFEEARELFRESLAARQRAATEMSGLGYTLKGLGDTLLALGELVEAKERLTEALNLFDASGDFTSAGLCLLQLCDIDKREGADNPARDKLSQALRFFVRIPDDYWIGFAHLRLARISTGSEVRRHVQRARSAWERAKRPDLIHNLNIEFPPT